MTRKSVAGRIVALSSCAALLTLTACADDTSSSDPNATSDGTTETSGDGDGDSTTNGDGDGDPDPATASGDGDGDPTTGDGDGDPTTGDGDGDPTTGDGDGDPTTGDGDGDMTGDGDGDMTGDGDGEPDPGTTMLRALHLGVDAPNVDIFVNGNPQPAIVDLPFQEGTPYIELPAGVYDIAISATGTPIDDAVLEVQGLDLMADTKYSAVAYNYTAELSALALVDDDADIDPANTRLQVSHTAPDVPQVDIWAVADPPIELISDLDFGGTASIDVPSGAYLIGVDVNDDAVPDVTFDVPELGGGVFVDVYAVNEAGGAPVFLLAHLPDGTTARIDQHVCGNGIIEGLETCDTDALNDQTCVDQGFTNGDLACLDDCSGYNLDGCFDQTCGNDLIEGDEVCDGTDVGGETCATLSPDVYADGALACADTCDGLDESQCTSGNCCDTGEANSCEVQAILDCVCGIDAFCCNNSWDSLCVDQAQDDCGAVCI